MSPPWPHRLTSWYRASHRDLPWRRTREPYRVWISEVMLQQTRVETVIPYFERFLARFPTVEALDAAPLEDVLKAWEGLGYYSRARNLHAAARELVLHHGGRLPTTAAALRELPGFGPYTSAAVASLAFGERTPVVDGNVLRVMARLLAVEVDPRGLHPRRRIDRALERAISGEDPSAFNQGLMELGALVCVPRSPRCPLCPLRADCTAARRGLQERLPVRPARRPVPTHEVLAAIVVRAGKVLVVRRPRRGLLGGLWEFPCGTRQRNESADVALQRGLREKTGLALRRTQPGPLTIVEHTFTHFHMTLVARACAAVGRVRPAADSEVRWVTPAELAALPLSVPDRHVAGCLSRTRTSLAKPAIFLASPRSRR
ncbi:MAG: A/G-specific adenine glycosylase [Planctomycetes bacterium]|nr:A/G-specific adenine glycosylase [Planctomycetota bacterium]